MPNHTKRNLAIAGLAGLLLLLLFGKTKATTPPTNTNYTLNITSTAGGYTDPTGSSEYTEETDVNIYAYANECYIFDHWELNGIFAGYADSITVRLQPSFPVAELQAVFAPT